MTLSSSSALPSKTAHLDIAPDPAQLSARLGARVAALSREAIAARGTFSVAISGGSLPKLLAAGLLAEAAGVDFSKWVVCLADERIVPLDAEDSNYRLVVEQITSKLAEEKQPVLLPIDPARGHEDCARHYRDLLRSEIPSFPVIDLVLLGLGPDGHTASLFPGHGLLEETEKEVASIADSPKPPPERVTLTLPVINSATEVMFVTAGGGKSDALRQIFEVENCGLPGQMVQPKSGKLMWFVDAAAGADLQ